MEMNTKETEIKMECKNCGETIKEGKWCTVGCKERFYIENYLGSSLVEVLEDWYKKKRQVALEESMRNFTAWQEKTGGKGFVEYLQSLGEFKQDSRGKDKTDCR